MDTKIEKLAEAFLILWEHGLRLRSNKVISGPEIISIMSKDTLLSIGWDPRVQPNEEDDKEFLCQYSEFVNLFR